MSRSKWKHWLNCVQRNNSSMGYKKDILDSLSLRTLPVNQKSNLGYKMIVVCKYILKVYDSNNKPVFVKSSHVHYICYWTVCQEKNNMLNLIHIQEFHWKSFYFLLSFVFRRGANNGALTNCIMSLNKSPGGPYSSIHLKLNMTYFQHTENINTFT